MILVSPGVDISIVDESNYPAASTATVPYILVATAQNKVNGAGTAVAPGTLASTANDTYLISSQRELVNTFGNPFFYKTSGGSSLHGYELNEYGLMAAYSVLGISNRAYVQRVDVDLAELSASLTRPAGNPDNGTYWLDTAETQWGIFEWNQATSAFTNKIPTVITSVNDLTGGVSGGVPLSSIGAIGDYSVDATNGNTPMYYKNRSNTWVLIGTADWERSHSAVTSNASPSGLTAADVFSINGSNVTLPASPTVTNIASAINTVAVTGVTAAAVNNRLEIYVDGTATNDAAVLAEVTNTPLADLGITAGTYRAPALQQSTHTNNPSWRTTDSAPRPTGSVWHKNTSVNLGASLAIKQYDSAVASFVSQTTGIYENDQGANKALDPSAGGSTIAAGTTYAMYDSSVNDTATIKVFRRTATGATEITGNQTSPSFTIGETFTIQASAKNETALTSAVTVTMTGTSATSFVSDLSGANVANVTASVLSTGAIKITHTQGGAIVLTDTSGNPTSDAGFITSVDNVRDNYVSGSASGVILSNWEVLATSSVGYSASNVQPGQDPSEGTKWYYSSVDEVDIMIHDGTGWKGYQNVSNDVRGYDLTATDPAGPLVGASAPTTQSDDTALVYGDIWVDTSDLENYPLINRWQSVDGVDQWVAIDTADQTTENGIVFADARWAGNSNTDPISDDIPTIASLLTSDYTDLDVVDENLYPTGTLLFNTRRSGYNVKEFRLNYFNASDFEGTMPTEKNAWVTASGLKDDGSPFMGRLAQRSIITQALKAGIDSNTDIREEERRFNLISCPGYPELIPNMVALNNERNNTAFIVGDSPMRLPQSGSDLITWATNNSGLGTSTGDGLPANDEYLGVFYPSGKASDLSGADIVVPPSHMMLRTIVHSDDMSYPWLAPAGARRGGIDNVSALGYIDAGEGEFRQTSIRQGVRDTLYENNVNPLTFIPGTGLVNFGNKTTVSGSALDRINVARLVAYIRLMVESAAKGYLFEPNDKLTRDEIKMSMEGIMNDLVAKRGLYDYLVVCDESNNTPARIDRNELYCDIAIEPVKATEFIYIPVRIKNTGEISGGN